jgi:polyisoprenoid-binding protein YceI
MTPTLRALLGTAALISIAAAAGDPAINVANSSIVATFRQENVPVDSAFKQFSGRIDYDPAHPAAARAMIQVATASLDMGSADYDAEVRKKDWLDSGAYPDASFVSSAITAGAPGHLTVAGTLSLKGRTQQLTIPVTMIKAGTATTFDGTLAISRKYFGIGTADWNGVLDDTVRIKFHLVE